MGCLRTGEHLAGGLGRSRSPNLLARELFLGCRVFVQTDCTMMVKCCNFFIFVLFPQGFALLHEMPKNTFPATVVICEGTDFAIRKHSYHLTNSRIRIKLFKVNVC